MKDLKGLSAEEVERSRDEHGSNVLERAKQKSFIRKFFENLGDPIIKILLLALTIEVVFTLGNCNFFAKERLCAVSFSITFFHIRSPPLAILQVFLLSFRFVLCLVICLDALRYFGELGSIIFKQGISLCLWLPAALVIIL